MLGEVIIWGFIILVLLVLAGWSAMIGLMANMDRGGIHPAYAAISGSFVLAIIFMLFNAPFHITFG
jgi:hypothetical protein